MSSAAETTTYLTYDANGNLAQDDRHIYEYDPFDNLIAVKDLNGAVITSYLYDEDGQRIRKTDHRIPGNSTTYYLGDFVQTVNSTGTFTSIYYKDGEGLIARTDKRTGSTTSSNGPPSNPQPDHAQTFFYHPDHLGSPVLATDLSGKTVSKAEFLPFGLETQGSQDRYGYTGQEQDPETDLTYYKSRYYSPTLMRFIQPDSVLPDVHDPQSLNLYSYALNNPVKFTDPSGQYVSPLDALDYASFAISLAEFSRDPSWSTAGWLTMDAVFVALPVIGGAGLLRRGIQAGGKTHEAAQILRTSGRTTETKSFFSIGKKGSFYGGKGSSVRKIDDSKTALKELRETGEVTADTFPEMHQLRKESSPGYTRVKGNSQKYESDSAYRKKILDYEKNLHRKGRGTWREDSSFNRAERRLWGHKAGQPHFDTPHIHIDPPKGKGSIIIKRKR